MQITNVNGKKWAVGFWWQPLTSSPRRQIGDLNRQGADAEESRAENEFCTFNYNVFVPLKKLGQVGVSGVQTVEEAVNLPSLAGALARLYGRNSNILAFFRFEDDNSWLFAIKDGQILPGGDLYGKTAGIVEQYRRFSQSDIWHRVIETDDTAETEEKILECLEALDDRIPEVRPVSRLFVVRQIPSVLKGRPGTTVGVGLLALLIAGGTAYQHYRNEQIRLEKRQERLEKKRELIEKKREMREKAKSLAEIRASIFREKWKDQPEPVLVVRSCYDTVREEKYQVSGWRLEGITCTPEKIRMTRKRMSWASFTRLPDNMKFRTGRPNTAVKTRQQNLGNREGSEITDRKTISANLYELARRMGSPIKLTWRKPEPRKISEKERRRNEDLPEMVFSPYWTGRFHLKKVPEYYIRNIGVLDQLPGLVVDRVEKNESWSIEGNVYAK